MTLRTGQWQGRRVFVVGGGPSLRGFDWSRLDGECWIGTNIAGFKAPVCLSVDGRWVREFGTDPRFLPATARVWLKTEGWLPDAPWQTVDASRPQRWTDRLEDGLVNGPLSGLTALHLADVLGASEIYLLGFDMQDDNHRENHFHDEYVKADHRLRAMGGYDASSAWEHSGACWAAHREHFERWAPCVRAEVTNLNPDSALTCFQKRRALWNRAGFAGTIVSTEAYFARR